MNTLKANAMTELLNLARNLNRVQLLIELFPADVEGPKPVHISAHGEGSMTYSAGEDMRHLPALLSAFGEDGWSLHQAGDQHSLFKTTRLHVTVYIDHIDPFSDALPKGCRRITIPQVEHSLS